MTKVEEVLNRINGTRERYRAVLGTPEGDKIIQDLCRRFFVTKPTFTTDKDRLVFNEGCRYVVLYIMSMLYKDDARLMEEIKKSIGEREE